MCCRFIDLGIVLCLPFYTFYRRSVDSWKIGKSCVTGYNLAMGWRKSFLQVQCSITS